MNEYQVNKFLKIAKKIKLLENEFQW